MKNVRKMSVILIISVMLICFGSINVFATNVTQNNIEVLLSTDKTNYSDSEQINVVLTAQNNKDVAITDVVLKNAIPNGYTCIKGSDIENFSIVNVGKTVSLDTTIKKDNSAAKIIASNVTVDTGSEWFTVLLLVTIGGISALITIYLLKNSSKHSKLSKKILSLIICVVMIIAYIPQTNLMVSATDEKSENITVSTIIKVGETDVTLSASVSYKVGGTFTLTFDSNGGTAVSPLSVIAGKTVTELDIPKKEGYIFSGWYIDKELTTKFDNSQEISQNMTLYAKWSTSEFYLSSDKNVMLVDGTKLVLYLETTMIADFIECKYGETEFTSSVQMYDNGIGVDDIAGDGVYSASIVPYADYDTTMNFKAVLEAKESNIVSVMCYLPIAESTYKAMDDIDVAIKELLENSGFKEKNDDDKINTIESMLNVYIEKGMVAKDSIWIDEECGIVGFEYPEGILGQVTYKEFLDGFNSLSDSEKINVSSVKKVTDTVEAGVGETGVSEKIGDAIILNSFAAFETTPKKIAYRTDYYNQLSSNWNAKGLTSTISWNPTVDTYKHLSEYEIICISTHGTISKGKKPAICLAETYKDNTYEIELKDKQIVKDSGHYSILPRFIEMQYDADELSESFVFSECCMSLGEGKGNESSTYDYTMADAFTGRSAKAYIGFHNSVLADYSRQFMAEYVARLIDGETSGVAYNSAIELLGENHEVWYNNTHSTLWSYAVEHPTPPKKAEKYNPDIHIAYPVHNGKTEAILVNTSLVNGGFEQYSKSDTTPNSWKCYGDVRTVTQLGDVSTYGSSSKRMVIVTSGIGAKNDAVLSDGTEGSSLSQTFKVPKDASKISFNYNFVSEEPMEWVGKKYDDAFVVHLDSGSYNFFNKMYESINTSEWKSVSGVNFVSGDNTAYQTGWKTAEIDVSAYRDKVITLSFFIYDVGDRLYDSACLIDNVTVN